MSKIFRPKIYYTKFKNDADLVIFITKEKNKADLIVKRVSHDDEVKQGFWKEVTLKADAELIVFISARDTTDVEKVYFTKFGDEVRFKRK